MSATPDRLVIARFGEAYAAASEGIERGLELKNRNAHVADQFGDEGSDIVPFDIAAQCHWSMEVWTLPVWDIAVLIGGNTWRWFRIHQDQEIIDSLKDMGYDFWHKNVLARIEPSIDGSNTWKEYLKQKFAKHTEVLRESSAESFGLLTGLVSVKAELEELESRKDVLENTLKAEIGDAAGIQWPNGAKLTWKRTKDPTAQVTDWEGIAFELATSMKMPLETQKALAADHTNTVVTRPGYRRLNISLPRAGK